MIVRINIHAVSSWQHMGVVGRRHWKHSAISDMDGKRSERLRFEEVSDIIRDHTDSSVFCAILQGKSIMARLVFVSPLFFSVFSRSLPRLSPSQLACEVPCSVVAKPADLPYCFCPTQ